MISPEALPFDIKVHRYMLNSTQPRALKEISPDLRQDYPRYQGYGSLYYIAERREGGIGVALAMGEAMPATIYRA